jgi:O-antigen ligase
MLRKLRNYLNLPGELRLFDWLLLFAPVVIWFSYHPVIFTLTNGDNSIQITPVIIYLVLMSVVSFYSLIRRLRRDDKVIKNYKKNTVIILILAADLLFILASLFWTVNLIRGSLEFIFLLGTSLVFLELLLSKNTKKLLLSLVRILLITAFAVSCVAWLQFFIGIAAPDFLNGFCNSCSAQAFGFVRPAGFAFEPQIFGNMIIAPLLIVAQKLLSANGKIPKYYILLFTFLVATIFITLSRGAIYAGVVGLAVILVVYCRNWRAVFKTVGFSVIGVFVAITAQGLTAQINPNAEISFSGAVANSIHQISMGKIDLRRDKNPDKPMIIESVPTGVESEFEPKPDSESEPARPEFDGYAPIATDNRLGKINLAVDAWRQSSSTVFFGVGLGGAGRSIIDNSDIGGDPNAAVIENQFVEILLERGIVGSLPFAALIVWLFYATRRRKWLWAILIAYLVQWNFFSGLPSVFWHIYLVFMMVYIYVMSKTNMI